MISYYDECNDCTLDGSPDWKQLSYSCSYTSYGSSIIRSCYGMMAAMCSLGISGMRLNTALGRCGDDNSV